MQPFHITPVEAPKPQIEPDFTLLQGWDNPLLQALETPHPSPSLMDLELLRQGSSTGIVFPVRGPAVTLGRYTPQTGPIDLDMSVLMDYERYQIDGVHLRLGLEPDGWWVESLTQQYPTFLSDQPISTSGSMVHDGNLLSLGQVMFRVRMHRHGLRGPSIQRAPTSCLRLKRDGAPTKAILPFTKSEQILGRSSPWTGPVDLDFSSLPDSERVFIARRHARIFLQQNRWFIERLSNRAHTCVNRQPLQTDAISLLNGDEVAIGNTLFLFQDVRPAHRTLAP